MVYIPTNWLVKPKNKDKVYELLDNLDRDLIMDELMTKAEVISELEKIGETLIIEKLNNYEIPFGA